MLAKPFIATDVTKAVVPTVASQLVTIGATLSVGASQGAILIQNNSSATIGVALAPDSAAAVLPTPAAASKCYVVVAGGGLILTTPSGTTGVHVVSDGAATGNVYLTPGFGL